MDKRYQVFVSSTYEDLKDERSEVIQALLELDCMPAGMELFPASTEQQWGWIKKVIDESDYYMVIVAGRYGSVHPTEKISYTEMEYRYAVSMGKPVLAFLHTNIESIVSGKTEKSTSGRAKLLDFRKLCQTRLCKMWDSPTDLGAKVSRSLTQLIKREPAIGWIRGDQGGGALRLELAEARLEIEKLKSTLNEKWNGSNEALAGGSDNLTIDYLVETSERRVGKNDKIYWVKGEEISYSPDFTWDEIIEILGADLLLSCDENDICRMLNQVAKNKLQNSYDTDENIRIDVLKIYDDSLKRIRVQFSALGLIDLDLGSSSGFS